MEAVSNKSLWFILLSVCMNRACSLLPSGVYFDPFPLHDILNSKGENVGINLQSYVYMITNHLGIISIWNGLRLVNWKLSSFFYKLIVIEIFSLLDFFIIYEHSWGLLFGWYPFEFTDIKIISYTYYIWKAGSNY